MAAVELSGEDLEKICDIYCKFPDICTTQEALDEKCEMCQLAAVAVNKSVHKKEVKVVIDYGSHDFDHIMNI